MSQEITMRCSKCGRRYDPAPADPQPRTCNCGAPFTGSVLFEEARNGEGIIVSGDVESEWPDV